MAHRWQESEKSKDSHTRREHRNVPDDYYYEEEEGSNNSYSEDEYSDDDGFEPAWAQNVGTKGDLFYVEAPSTSSVQKTQDNQTHHVTFATSQNNNSKLNGNEASNGKQGVSPKTKLNKKGLSKLKGLIKKSSSKDQVQSLQQNGHSSSASQEGVIKEVVLYVDPDRHNYGRRASLCESLFGIIPGQFGHKLLSKGQKNGVKNSRIMVQGLVPDGEAMKSGHIKLGDWLMCVNDMEVTFADIDNVLSTITDPKQVKLTLQKPVLESSSSSLITKNPVINENLVKLVSGERLEAYKPDLSKHPHSVMYLTLEGSSETMKDKEDILYQFPKASSKLVDVRGMFITLSHVLADVANSYAKNSTVVCDGRLLHIGYATEVRDVLLVALPSDRISVLELNHIVEDIVRLMKVLYGSLGSAFGDPNNQQRLDHFFNLLFHHALLRDEMASHGLRVQDPQSDIFLDTLQAVKWLMIPDEPKINVDNILSELEAADFTDMSDEYFDLRRSYTILGSCVFYKGYLIANHLHKEDLLDLSLYAKHYGLLALSQEQEVGQVVVWKEVFPTRRCHVQVDPLIPGYTEPEARWFMLVVGLKHKLLCVLLEAGGCSAWAEGNPTPDPFYVDQAKATLLQLDSTDITNYCEARLQCPSCPSLASVDWFFPHHKGAKEDSPAPKIQNSPKSGVKKLGVPDSTRKKKQPSPLLDGRKVLTITRTVFEIESDADSTVSDPSLPNTPRNEVGRKPSAGSDESGESASSSNIFRSTRKGRMLPSSFDLNGLKKELNEYNDNSIVKLTSGCENTMFYYVNMDALEGVYVCPNQKDLGSVISATDKQLLKNFYNCCLLIRRVFEKTMKTREKLEKNLPNGGFGADTSLGSVKEHGVLFQCTPENWTDTKKPPPTVAYWVVGRLFFEPYPRELYVCFHDSAEQNVVEMAFKLSFGNVV